MKKNYRDIQMKIIPELYMVTSEKSGGTPYIDCHIKIPQNYHVTYALKSASAEITALRRLHCRLCGEKKDSSMLKYRVQLCRAHFNASAQKNRVKRVLSGRPTKLTHFTKKSAIWDEIEKANNLTLPDLNLKSNPY